MELQIFHLKSNNKLFNHTKNFDNLVCPENQIYQAVVADNEVLNLTPEIILVVTKVYKLNCKSKKYIV